MTVVRPEFFEQLERFGIGKSFACFNCGTCSAICPLIHQHFPRKIIRYAQLGAIDRILENAEELWRCLHCGLCTQTCPREASPGELILGLRRFVVERWRRVQHV